MTKIEIIRLANHVEAMQLLQEIAKEERNIVHKTDREQREALVRIDYYAKEIKRLLG